MPKQKGTESIASKKTTPINSKWFMNTAKSIGFSAADIISEITPGISGFMSENLQYAQDLRESLKSAKDNSKSLADQFNMAAQFDIAKEAIRNAKDDLKTGNFYNKERIDESFNNGFDMDGMFDDDNFDQSDSSSPDSKVSAEAKNLESRIQSNRVLADVTRASASGIMDSITRSSENMTSVADAMMGNSRNIAQTTLMVGQKMHDETITGLESINKNIGLLVNFNNDSMAKYVAASIHFYDQSIALQNKLSPQEEEKKPIKERDSDRIFSGMGGAFSSRGYVDVVRKNMRVFKEENMLLSTLDSFFQDTDTLKNLAQSPLSFISNKMATKILPEFTKATMKQLDESFTSFFPALMNKISRGKGSSNILIRSLSEIFGIDDGIKTNVNFGIKPNLPGQITNRFIRTVEEVIPTYLRQMTSSLTGLEESSYNMENGKWGSVSNLQKELDTRLDNAKVSGYSDTRDYLKTMGDRLDFGTEKNNISFMQGIDKFLKGLTGAEGLVNLTNSKEVEDVYKFGTGEQQEAFMSMLSTLTNSQRMGLVGRDKLSSRKEVARIYEEIEREGTMGGRTILSNANINKAFEKDKDGKLVLKKGSQPGSMDSFGMTTLDYLRNILKVISDGIRTYPVSVGKKNKGPSVQNQYKETAGYKAFKDIKNDEDKEKSKKTEEVIKGNKVTKDNSADPNNKKIFVGRQATSDAHMQNVFKGAIDEYEGKKEREVEEKRKKSLLDYVMKSADGERKTAMNSVREFVDNIVGTPAKVMESAFRRIDGTMHDIIFGKKDDDSQTFISSLQVSFDKQFFRMTQFMQEKLINPVVDKIAGPNGLIEKIKGTSMYQSIAKQVSAIFVGGVAADGSEMQGLFGQRIKQASGWISDSSKALVHMIGGQGYVKSDGTKVEKKEDSLMNKTSSFIKGIFGETKNYMFGDKNSTDPDKRRGSMTFITDTLGKGMIAWRDAMFGPSGRENETGTTVMKDLAGSVRKGLPRAFGGYLAGAALGGLAVSSLGLIGATLLPGAPMGLAIAGAALGFASRSDNFMDWAFGEKGGDGRRIGGMLLKRHHADFWKNNKNKIIGGAGAGIATSAVLGSVMSMLGPIGVLGAMLTPAGPVGAAMMGIGSAFILRSESFQSMMFGPKNADGKRVGGMIGRMFGNSSKKIGNQASGGTKLGAAIIGGTGGLLAGNLLGGAGLLGLMLTPAGPIGAALLGTAAGIAVTSEKFNTFMFGKWREEDGMREGGIFTKIGNWMRLEIMAPFRNAIGGAADYMKYWFKHSVAAPIGFMTEPLIKLAKDAISTTMNMLKFTAKAMWKTTTFIPKMIGKTISSGWNLVAGAINNSFEKRVGIPLSEAFTRFLFRPFAKLGKGILKSFAIAGKAATSAVMAPGMILASGKMGYDSAKSMGRYVAGNVRTGNIGAAFDPALMADTVFGQNGEGNYVAERYSEFRKQRKNSKDEYKASREHRKQIQREQREEQNAYMKNGYNKYGKIDYREMVLGKLEDERVKGLGVSAHEILGLQDSSDLNAISQRQMKFLNSKIWDSIKSGKTGDDLRAHLKLVERPEASAEEKTVSGVNATNRTLDDIKEIIKNDKGFDINNSKHTNILGRMLTQSMTTAVQDAMGGLSLSNMVDTSDIDSAKSSFKLSRGVKGIKFRNETANLRFSAETDDREFGSASTGTAGSMVAVGGSNKTIDMSIVGCGPKAVSIALSMFGKNVSPEQVIARVSPKEASATRGLSLDSVSKALKEFGLRVSSKSLSKTAIIQAFKSGINVQLVYMKKYVGGHFIIISNYDEANGAVNVTDPDNKISGRRSIEWIISSSGGGRILTLSDGSIVSRVNTLGNTIKSTNPITGITNATKNMAMGALTKVPGMISLMNKVSSSEANMLTGLHALLFGKGSSIPVSIMDGGKDEESTVSGGGSSDAFRDGGGIDRGTTIGVMKYIADAVKFIGKSIVTGIKVIGKGISTIGGAVYRGVGKAFTAVKGMFNGEQSQPSQNQPSGRRRGNGMMTGIRNRVGGLFSGGPAITASKVSSALVRAGNVATAAMSRVPGALNTSTGAVDGYSFGKKVTDNLDDKHAYNSRLTVSKYLEDKAAEAKAAEESSFRSNSVDMLTRIEINTRTISEVLGDMFDMQKGFFDWLKKFLEKSLPDMFNDLKKSLSDAIRDGGNGGGYGAAGTGGDSDVDVNGRKTGTYLIRRRLRLIHKLMEKMFKDALAKTLLLRAINKDIGMLGKKLVKMHLQQVETHAAVKVVGTNTRNTTRGIMKTNEHLIEILAAIRLCCKNKSPKTTPPPNNNTSRPLGLPAPGNGGTRTALPGPSNTDRTLALPGPNPNQPRLGNTPRHETPTGRDGQTVVTYGNNGNAPVSNPNRTGGAIDAEFTDVAGSEPINGTGYNRGPQPLLGTPPGQSTVSPVHPVNTAGSQVAGMNQSPPVIGNRRVRTMGGSYIRQGNQPQPPIIQQGPTPDINGSQDNNGHNGNQGNNGRFGGIFNQNMGIVPRMFSQGTYDAVADAGEATRGFLGKIGKGIGKTFGKVGAVAGTGGAAMLGFGAMDAAYGYQNADMILGKEEGEEISKAERSAASTAAVITGTLPILDMVDEIMGNKAKKFIAESILATGPVIDKAKEIWTGMYESVSNVVGNIKDKTVEVFTAMKDWTTEKFTATKDWVVDKTTAIWDGTIGAFTAMKDWTVEKFTATKDWVIDSTTALWDGSVKAFTTMKETAVEKFTTLKDTVVNKTIELWKKGTEAFSTMKTKAVEKVVELKDKSIAFVTTLASDGVKKFGELKDKVVGKIQELVTNGVTKLKDMVTDTGKKLTEFKDNIVNTVTELPGKALESLKTLGTDVGKAVSEFAGKVLEWVKNLNPLPSGNGEGIYGAGKVYAPKGNTFMLPAKQRTKLLNNVYDDIDTYGGGDVSGGCPTCHGPNCTCSTGSGAGSKVNGDIYYSQKDSRWANNTVDGKLKMGSGGCGPTAASMVVSSLTGDNVTPDDANKFAIANGMTDEKRGTSSNLFSQFGASRGVSVMEDRVDPGSVSSQLASGNKVILRGQGGRNFTNGGHFVVATGMTKDGKVKINDPLSKGRSGSYDIDTVMKNTTNAYVAGKSTSNILSGTYANGIGSQMYKTKGNDMLASTFGTGVSGVDFVKEGMKHLKKPYIWGGRNLDKGADCSGFTQEVIRRVMGKLVLSGNAHTQMGSSNLIDVKLSDACVGDIIWFHGTYGSYGRNHATHIAFISGNNEMIGASGDNKTGSIRFDVIDKSYWWPRVIKVRRIKGTTPGPKVILDGKVSYKKSYYTPNDPKLTGGTPPPGENTTSTLGSIASIGSDVMNKYNEKIAGLSVMDKLGDFPKMFENIMMNEILGTKFDYRRGTAFELPTAITAGATAASIAGDLLKSGIDVNSSGSFNPTGDKKKFIDTVRPGAMRGQKEHKVLASLTLAQGALESGWGKKSIGNNLFGIKAGKNWTGKTKTVRTREVDKSGKSYYVNAAFRDYDTIDDSILDHTKLLLNPRYSKVLSAKNYKEATKAVKDAGYATDPKYPSLLNSIIESNKLMNFDNEVMGGGNIDNTKPMNKDQMNEYQSGSLINELRASKNVMSSRGFGNSKPASAVQIPKFDLRKSEPTKPTPHSNIPSLPVTKDIEPPVFGSGDFLTNKMEYSEAVTNKKKYDIERSQSTHKESHATGPLDASQSYQNNTQYNTTVGQMPVEAVNDILSYLSAIANNTDAIKNAPGVVSPPAGSVEYNDNRAAITTTPSGTGDNMLVTQIPQDNGNSLNNAPNDEIMIRAALVAAGRQ